VADISKREGSSSASRMVSVPCDLHIILVLTTLLTVR